MGAYSKMDKAIPGLKVNLGNSRVVSKAVGERTGILPGSPVMEIVGEPGIGYAARRDTLTLAGNADFVASNSIVVTINGQALDAVVYATSHAATLTSVINAINAAAIDGITAIAGGARDVVLKARGVEIASASIVVTAGASQPTFTGTYSVAGKFAGIAVMEQTSEVDRAGAFSYKYAMGVDEFGCRWAPAVAGAKSGEAAYIVTSGADQGKFTNSNSGTYDAGCVFRSNAETINGQVLAQVEVRGIK